MLQHLKAGNWTCRALSLQICACKQLDLFCNLTNSELAYQLLLQVPVCSVDLIQQLLKPAQLQQMHVCMDLAARDPRFQNFLIVPSMMDARLGSGTIPEKLVRSC